MDTKKTVFALVKPPSKIISVHLPKNSKDRKGLLDRAKESGYLLYSAQAESRNGKYIVQQPWILDLESIPVPKQEQVQIEESDGLSCPFCGKKVTSTPGRTLHVKGCHPDKFDEYRKWLKS